MAWAATFVKTVPDDREHLLAVVVYSNASTQKTLPPETVSMNGTENDFRARVRARLNELDSSEGVAFKLSPGPIDTTPIPPTLTAEQQARAAYDVAYRKSARAQLAVRDGVLLSSDKAVTDRAAAAKALFQEGYLDS